MVNDSKHHIHKFIISSGVFVRRGNKYLVIKRSEQKRYAPGYAHFVGGKVERGENPYLTAKREVLEESGIRIKNMKLRAVILEISPVEGEPYDWMIYHFTANYDSGKIKETDEGKLIWMTKSEIHKQNLFPSLKKLSRYIFDEKTGTVFATFDYDKSGKEIVKSRIDFCK